MVTCCSFSLACAGCPLTSRTIDAPFASYEAFCVHKVRKRGVGTLVARSCAARSRGAAAAAASRARPLRRLCRASVWRLCPLLVCCLDERTSVGMKARLSIKGLRKPHGDACEQKPAHVRSYNNHFRSNEKTPALCSCAVRVLVRPLGAEQLQAPRFSSHKFWALGRFLHASIAKQEREGIGRESRREKLRPRLFAMRAGVANAHDDARVSHLKPRTFIHHRAIASEGTLLRLKGMRGGGRDRTRHTLCGCGRGKTHQSPLQQTHA